MWPKFSSEFKLDSLNIWTGELPKWPWIGNDEKCAKKTQNSAKRRKFEGSIPGSLVTFHLWYINIYTYHIIYVNILYTSFYIYRVSESIMMDNEGIGYKFSYSHFVSTNCVLTPITSLNYSHFHHFRLRLVGIKIINFFMPKRYVYGLGRKYRHSDLYMIITIEQTWDAFLVWIRI